MLRNASLVALSSLLLIAGCAAQSADDDVSSEIEGSADAITSKSETKVLDVPFYFAVPKAAMTTPIDRSKFPYPTVWNPSTEIADAGLRVIAIQQNGTAPAAKKAARIDMAKKLAKAGVLQDGDIALTFRPNLATTMAYPHIQMGVTHASLVYTQNGEAFNIDSPLDGEYVGQFSTLHFTGGVNASGKTDTGTDALQIVRPRNMDATRKASLQGWIGSLKTNLSRINGQRAQVKFQSDYLTPIFASKQMTTQQTVTMLGKIILEQDTTTKLPMYCSEFAWHMIALSNCSADEIKNAGPEGAACVDPVFEPMQLVSTTEGSMGLGEGPLTNILLAPPTSHAALTAQLFKTTNPAGLSPGHRDVSEALEKRGLIKGLETYYGGKTAAAATALPDSVLADIAAGAAKINAGVSNVGNYSPTAFLAQSMLPAGVRPVDYVATIVFVDTAADYAKAQRLAKNPVP